MTREFSNLHKRAVFPAESARVLSPLRGQSIFRFLPPRLTPWALLLRRFAAGVGGKGDMQRVRFW